jgi:hypothetical protein
MSVDGGISDNPEHTITNAVVRDTYIGEVYQNTMAVTKSTTFPFQAFRTLKKGVAFVEGMWRPVLAHPAGVRLDRLFPFPSNIMDLAAKYAKSAQWVEDSVDDEDEDEDGDEDETVDGDDEEDAEEDVEDPADKEKDKHKTTPVKKTARQEQACFHPPRAPRRSPDQRSAGAFHAGGKIGMRQRGLRRVTILVRYGQKSDQCVL